MTGKFVKEIIGVCWRYNSTTIHVGGTATLVPPQNSRQKRKRQSTQS